MRHSIFPKASLFLASAVAVTSLHALPGLAQSESGVQSTSQPQIVQLDRSVQQIQPIRRTPSGHADFPVGGLNLNNHSCPEGTVLVMWDMPIYDDEGLFVIGYEPTPFCVDEDLEPAG
jgi:hypothetical protein